MSIIEVSGLCKAFDGKKVLEDVSFQVEKGEIIAIIGASGGGKSTLLRSLINLERADGGTIVINGKPLLQNGIYAPEKTARHICLDMSMVFQSFNLFPHMSVLKNLILAPMSVLKESRESAISRAKTMLQTVGLSDKIDAMPNSLSGGQQQRVAIARALMLNPEILLFDEPTSSLDPLLTMEVLDVMRKLAAERRTMLVVTHELSFAKECASRIFCMDAGHIAKVYVPGDMDSLEGLDTLYRPTGLLA